MLAVRASVMAGHTREQTKALLDEIQNVTLEPCQCPRATRTPSPRSKKTATKEESHGQGEDPLQEATRRRTS